MAKITWRKVLGFPEPQTPTTRPAAEVRPDPAQWAVSSQSWEAQNQPTPTRVDPADDEPAEPVEPTRTAPWDKPVSRPGRWPVALRVLVTLVLVLLVFKGLQGMFLPRQVEVAGQTVAAFPEVAAAGLAVPFAEAYATWDETHPELRQAALKPLWGGDLLAGWNGHGWQSVMQATARQVRPVSSTSCVVTVVLVVTRYAGADKSSPVNQLQALDVPVTVTGGVGTVTALPTWVAVPAPAVPSPTYLTATDSALGTSTKSTGAAFFAAYGRDSDLSAITAPGASIAGLAGAVTLVQVSSWEVAPPQGDTAQARAVVEWSTGTAQLTQTYTLTLTRTTTVSGSRWQVFSLS